MIGYTTLREKADSFLRNNPDVQAVTLRRPPPKDAKLVYTNANQECYGRMPESCPIVQGILNWALPPGMKIVGEDGREINVSNLRDEIFSEIHSQVTGKFRRALEDVCEQKHLLLARVREQHKHLAGWIDEAETLLPPESQKKARRRGEVEIEVDAADEDDGDYGL